MDVDFKIEITPEDVGLLADVLDCSKDEVPRYLAGHAKAALWEYLEAYLGRRAFSRGSDILEHRLALLIKHAYGNRIIGEAEVSRLFQSTLPTSRSLLRSALSKYRFDLAKAAETSVRIVLEGAKWSEDDNQYTVNIGARNLVDFLNQRLEAEYTGQRAISAAKDCIGTYAIAPGSYDGLCKAFNAKAVSRT
jgi:hypothetical protein